MKTSLLYLALCGLLVTIITACAPSRPEIIPIDPAFGHYISGYTSGMIDRNETIRIELTEPSERLEELSEEELNALFDSEPHIPGKVIAIGDRILEFVPENPMTVNQFYTVHFNLDKVARVKSAYSDFVFQFATNSQKIDVHFNGLRPYNNYNIEYLKMEGYITTSQQEDTAKVKKILQARLGSTSKNIRYTEHSYNTSYFVIDSIRRADVPLNLVIEWNGALINSMSSGKKSYLIPAMGDFSVNDIQVRESDDQQVEITFSEPLDNNQQLEGLITLSGVDQTSYKINRNVVTVFLPKRYTGTYQLKVHTGIKNSAGYPLKEKYEDHIYLHEAYPKLKMSGNGTILPNSQGLIFPFEAIALNSVTVRVIRVYEKNVHYFLQVNDLDGEDELTRFGKIIAEQKIDLQKNKKLNLKQWNTHVINLEKLIQTEPGAIYQVAIKFDQSDAICDCRDNETEAFNHEVYDPEDESWNEAYWHSYGFEGYSSWSYYNDESTTPCDANYYYGRAITRNILASNIGMIFKLDEDRTSHAFLSDMVSTEPVANATVSYYDYSKNLIASVTTDSKGMASVKLREKPFLMIASKGQQRGYLKLTDGHVNSLSKFDVSGELVQKGVKGYIYGERGVWRPGDSLFLTFMLQDKLNQLPDNHPVKFELYDPHGNIVFQQSKTKHLNSVYDFRTATSPDAPTGNYRAIVQVGNKEFRQSLRVETVKPNRLKVQLNVEKGKFQDSCILQAKWLHGASARDLDATVTVNLSPLRTQFKGYEQYTFDSPIRKAASDSKVVFSGKLDSSGKAAFASRFEQIDDAAGMMQANYVTKVFEKSGNFSIDRKVASFSPFNSYVGIRAPEGSKYDQTLETDHKHRFEIVNLLPDGRKTNRHQIHIQVFKVRWNWWYDSDNTNLTNFTGRNSALPVHEEKRSTSNGTTYFDFDVKYPDYGSYLILVTDLDGGHQTGKVVHIDWPYWNRGNRSNNEFASMLSFSLDKEKYTKGEHVQLSFPSPSDGRALVSIETSQKVIQKFWISTKKGETLHTFEATSDMAPNAFIHVTLLQPHHATKNDLPIRMYGVKPLLVDDPNTHLNPTIQVPDVIRPESTTHITVREEKGRRMTYTLAIVDDGLLDLTAFRTPQPHNAFYAREALGVKTWDMYDNVIGAFSGKMDNLYTIGGDAAAVTGKGLKANRFEPMVRYLGPFELPAGKSKTHAISIPNYVGSVRVMVVARDEQAYGNAQKTVTVKKPLMVLATLPRVLGPEEEFSLPVDVFAMEKHVKNVQVKLASNDQFELLDSPSKSIQFNETGDQVVNFRFKVKNNIGIGKITIRASSGSESATQELEVDVRPANPVRYDVESIEIAPGKSAQLHLNMNGIPGTNTGTIEYATLPAIQLEKRLGYLIHYPHGCLEQTTSSVFPQLYLSKLSETTVKEQQQIANNIRAGIKRLQLFQQGEGGFSYWPGESHASDWGSNYAGHFMLEAEAIGYKLPVRMKDRWITYQRTTARNWTLNTSASQGTQRAEQLSQAYRLYLLAYANQPEIGAMNRLREEKKLSTAARWRLAAAYSLIGQKEVAERLSSQASEDLPLYRELSGTFGSQFRDRAILLESMSILHQRDKAHHTLKLVAAELSSDKWLSTQETAYGLLAIARYVNSQHAGSTTTLVLSGDAHSTVSAHRKLQKITFSEKQGKTRQTVSIKNTGTSSVFITATTQKIAVAGNESKKSSNLRLSVEYTDFQGRPVQTGKLKQGTEFMAVVTITNPSKTEYYKEMSLEQLFPSGWEVHNTRLFGGQGNAGHTRYQDIRDDRVYSYFDLGPQKSITITIQLNATYLGKYYLPAVYSEAMYDHTIHAQVPGKWVTVE